MEILRAQYEYYMKHGFVILKRSAEGLRSPYPRVNQVSKVRDSVDFFYGLAQNIFRV